MSTRVGVVFSGCGVFDGTEVTAAAGVLIALDRRGATAVCMAPDEPQRVTIDPLTGRPELPPRNALREAARLARGKVVDIATVRADDLDALIFPGGDGAAANLSTFADEGDACQVNEHVRRLIRDCHAAGKPIGAACVAPVLLARVLGGVGARPTLTIGTDARTAGAIERMGAVHRDTPPAGVAIDEVNRVVTTPCYMNDVGPWVVFQGAEKMVEEVLNLAGGAVEPLRRDWLNSFAAEGR